jgi:leucyl aminopeptidase
MSNLTVTISGGSGDADLYVNYGSPSTSSNYQCRPYKNGNEETCQISNPQAGTWYIDLQGYSSVLGVTLTIEAQ